MNQKQNQTWFPAQRHTGMTRGGWIPAQVHTGMTGRGLDPGSTTYREDNAFGSYDRSPLLSRPSQPLPHCFAAIKSPLRAASSRRTSQRNYTLSQRREMPQLQTKIPKGGISLGDLLFPMARRTRFELVTFGSVVRCSIQLSYRRSSLLMAVRQGFEPWRAVLATLPA